MFRSQVHTALQGFVAGAIVMAYITNYNRSKLPMAICCLLLSIAPRLEPED